jgi:DNA-binding beta-propeller fold protein YncE
VTGDGRTALITNYGDRSNAGRSLTVVDVPSASVRTTIDLPLYERPHGIAILPGDSLAVVTSETQAVVVLVHIDSGEIQGTIPTRGRTSHMLGADATGRRVFTTNIVDGTISELDPRSGTFVRTIAVAPVIEGLTVSPDGRHVWVGSNRERTVSVVDVARGIVIDTLTDFGFPYRMGITPDGRTAVLVDPARAEIRIVDTATRRERTRVRVPATGIVPGAEFPDSSSPEGIAMGRGSRFAYVSLQGRNEAAAIDLTSGEIAATYPTGTWPDGIGYSPIGR